MRLEFQSFDLFTSTCIFKNFFSRFILGQTSDKILMYTSPNTNET